jgi:hypothetical protein
MDEDDGRKMRVQMDLIPGRDDLAIEALVGLKPRHRAEKLRQCLMLYLSGRSSVSERHQEAVKGTESSRTSQVVKEPASDDMKTMTVTEGGIDMSQLDGVDMEMDFIGMGGVTK